ncbi:hypothetical protein SAMN05444166_4735 [Singulisphaera sp. GP187]|nr:hypothetical protein SAMN05444166_4735 [Singulisphaera sp. GP187]
MKALVVFVLGVMLAGGSSAIGQVAKQAEETARLKARLELAELDHEAEKVLLKESIMLVNRAERDKIVNQKPSQDVENSQAKELAALHQYVEASRRHFEEQAVELERIKRELAAASMNPRTTRNVPTRPQQPAPEQAELLGQLNEITLNSELLNAKLTLITNELNRRTNTLANLEVQGDEASGGDEKRREALEVARKRYDEVRKNYLDLKKKVEEQQSRRSELQRQVGGFQ